MYRCRYRWLIAPWQEPLQKLVAEWLFLFVETGQVIELRALNVEQSPGISESGRDITRSASLIAWPKMP